MFARVPRVRLRPQDSGQEAVESPLFLFAFENDQWLDAGMDGAANRVEVLRLAGETHAPRAWIF